MFKYTATIKTFGVIYKDSGIIILFLLGAKAPLELAHVKNKLNKLELSCAKLSLA